MEKRDCMSECNNLQVPLDEFAMQFCARCLQAECTRSLHGKSRFEARVENWQDKLFRNPARLDPTDPRVKEIQGKRFLDVFQGPIPEIGRGPAPSAWLDPRDLAAEPPVQAPAPQEPAAPLVVEAAPPPPVVESAPQPSTPTPSPGLPRNTPFRQGQMLGGQAPASKTSAPVYDPWAAPKPGQTDGLTVVKPGARIKLGGG